MQKSVSTSSSRPRALLVACDGVERHYLRGRLSLRGVDCADVDEGASAIEYCADHPVDLVVVDADHLGAGAMRLLRQLRTPHACRPAPHVALMGQLARGPRWRATWAKARVLAKPLDPRALDAWIVHSLGPALSAPAPKVLFEASVVR